MTMSCLYGSEGQWILVGGASHRCYATKEPAPEGRWRLGKIFLVPKFYLGTHLLRQFYCRSPREEAEKKSARNEISRGTRDVPKWNLGTRGKAP